MLFAECLAGVKLITGVSPPAYSVDLLNKDEIHKVFIKVVSVYMDLSYDVVIPPAKRSFRGVYPPQNEVLGGYTVFSLSVIP